MTKLTYPTSRPYRPSQMIWSFKDNARRSGKSSETGTTQWSERPGAHLRFTCHWTNQTKKDRLLLWAKLCELHGHINTFDIPFFPNPVPQLQPFTGTTFLSVATIQGANACSVSGFGAGCFFSQGDFITIGTQPVIVHTCALSGGALQTTFSPRLRQAWAISTPVTYNWAVGEFRLASATAAIELPFGPDVYTPFSCEFEEAL